MDIQGRLGGWVAGWLRERVDGWMGGRILSLCVCGWRNNVWGVGGRVENVGRIGMV